MKIKTWNSTSLSFTIECKQLLQGYLKPFFLAQTSKCKKILNATSLLSNHILVKMAKPKPDNLMIRVQIQFKWNNGTKVL